MKKETLARVFSCEFCEISKITFFTEHLRATASATVNVKVTSLVVGFLIQMQFSVVIGDLLVLFMLFLLLM